MLPPILLVFCSGYIFAVGALSLIVGFSRAKERTYLYFGLLSLLNSAFIVLQISRQYNSNIS